MIGAFSTSHVVKREQWHNAPRTWSALIAAATMTICLSSGAGGIAAGPAVQSSGPPQQGKTLPAGLRVAPRGWCLENSGPLCKAAGIDGHRNIRPADVDNVEKITSLLEKGEIDVFVLCFREDSPHLRKPEWSALVELGPKYNPDFRGVYAQTLWVVHDGRKIQSPEDYEHTDLAELQVKMDASRKRQEAWADEVNTKAGKRVVFLVPVSEAILELRKMIKAGKFPGVTRQSGPATDPPRPGFTSALAGDIMPHPGLLGSLLGQYMYFAAMYCMSPEGLPVGDHLDEAQRKILQKLAWQTVSQYRYAGVAAEPKP